MIKDMNKINKYEFKLSYYILKLSDKPEWSRNDFENIYNKLLIFIKKIEIEEISLLNSGFLLLKQSEIYDNIKFNDYNDIKNRFRFMLINLSIPEAIACIACITKVIITDDKIDFNDLKKEVDEI